MIEGLSREGLIGYVSRVWVRVWVRRDPIYLTEEPRSFPVISLNHDSSPLKFLHLSTSPSPYLPLFSTQSHLEDSGIKNNAGARGPPNSFVSLTQVPIAIHQPLMIVYFFNQDI